MSGNSMLDRGSRAEHVAWCKQRALEYVERGDFAGALASMTSDLGKHSETADSVSTAGLGVSLYMAAVFVHPKISGHLNTKEKMRDWIEGFN